MGSRWTSGAVRAEYLTLVSGLRPDDLERVGIHRLANTQARVSPQMGNAQRFSTLDG
jgi:hypothetical protein